MVRLGVHLCKLMFQFVCVEKSTLSFHFWVYCHFKRLLFASIVIYTSLLLK